MNRKYTRAETPWDRLKKWYNGEYDAMGDMLGDEQRHDSPREELKLQRRRLASIAESGQEARRINALELRGFYTAYRVIAVICCIVLTGVLLYTVANMPRYGAENPRAMEVARRYIEDGVEETGAVNAVAGMILDYRAFDTLGESHVLFTALLCVMILLRLDSKNTRAGLEDYYTIANDSYFDVSGDPALRTAARALLPMIFIYGAYVLLNGQNSPGGGFSGGAVLGAALIIYSTAYGFGRADRLFSRRMTTAVTFCALAFYSFAKGYVFITGANGIPNGIPKGTPGAILSGGLILPLDIAVGLVVACTMYGFYSLFKRGNIGGD